MKEIEMPIFWLIMAQFFVTCSNLFLSL